MLNKQKAKSAVANFAFVFVLLKRQCITRVFLWYRLLPVKCTKVIQFSTTHFTAFVDCNTFDKRRINGKIRSTPTLPEILRTVKRFCFRVNNFDHVATKFLNTLFASFNDTIRYSYCISLLWKPDAFCQQRNACSAILIKSILLFFK